MMLDHQQKNITIDKRGILCAFLLSVCWQVALLQIALEGVVTSVSAQQYSNRSLESR